MVFFSFSAAVKLIDMTKKTFIAKKHWTVTITAMFFVCCFSSFNAEHPSCHGAYDLYFVLDRSGSIANDWGQVYDFVKSLTERLMSPNLRVSFIVFSTRAQIMLPLTGDRAQIDDGLKRLSEVKPFGESYMHEGIKLASKQIKEQVKKSSSGIVVLTDGQLQTYIKQLTKDEADIARTYGARVYCVGIKDFDEAELADVADTREQVFPVNGGSQDIVNSEMKKGLEWRFRPSKTQIFKQLCTEVLTVEPVDCGCMKHVVQMVCLQLEQMQKMLQVQKVNI